MSSERGSEFGEEYAERYSEFLSEWEQRVEGREYSDEMAKEWGNELNGVLGETIAGLAVADLMAKLEQGDMVLTDNTTLYRWAAIALKAAIVLGAADLLRRLITSKNNEGPQCEPTEFAACVRELKARSKQTLSQIFDMVRDKMTQLAVRFFTKNGDLTGRRRWVAEGGKNSRHSSLNGQIRNEGARFNYKGNRIDGPRPINGKPEHWSNCSCHLQAERKRGGRLEWIDL